MKKLTLSLTLLLLSSSVKLLAQAGDLDNSFDEDGKVQTSISSNADVIRSLAIYPDGRILAAGSSRSSNNSYWDFSLARYNPNGSLDTSFSGDGKIVTNFGPKDDEIYSVVLQEDGKIVAAGTTDNGNNLNFAIVRYNIDGSLDETFASGGKLSFLFNADTTSEACFSATLQSDGKIILAGYSGQGSFRDFAIARLLTDGSFDNSFDEDGKITTNIGFFTIDEVRSIVLQLDGKIVAGGNLATGLIALVRYNMDGSLDSTFSEEGIVALKLGDIVSKTTINTIAVQTDGKIITGGSQLDDLDYNFQLSRFTQDGELDTLFGNGGKRILILGSGHDAIRSIAIQSDGKIVACGVVGGSQSNFYFTLVRFNETGSLDSTFSDDGIVYTNFSGSNNVSHPYAVAIQPDHKIVAGGVYGTGSETNYALARYFSSDLSDLPVSIASTDLRIYPNPTSGAFQFDIPAGIQIEKILLIDATGKHHREFKSTIDNHFVLERKGLPAGLYVVQLIVANGQRSLYGKVVFVD